MQHIPAAAADETPQATPGPEVAAGSATDPNGPVWHRSRARRLGVIVAALLVLGWVAYWTFFADSAPPTEDLVADLVATEEWILEATPHLAGLSRSVLNLRVPDALGGELFYRQVYVRGLASGTPQPTEHVKSVGIARSRWVVAAAGRSVPREELELWKPLLGQVAYFEHAKFKIIAARFTEDEGHGREIETDLWFDGLARSGKGSLVEVQAAQLVRWRKEPKTAQPDQREGKSPRLGWRIVRWEQQTLTTASREQPLFEEVLDVVVPQADQRAAARESIHERYILDLAHDRLIRPHEQFSVPAIDRHPGLSVVDVDRDGHDDLYVMARWGRNLLFRNRGDGSFEEVAKRFGLDVEAHCSSAVFADFDNDGDADCLLGRTLERSMYLRNEGGRFVDRSDDLVGVPLPYLVFSVSAADYNNDGLLDVFLATYAADMVANYANASKPLPERFLPPDQLAQLFQMQRQKNETLDREGPPNVLLSNRGGGRFELAPENDQLALWRNTTQGTWADYDNDGDQDLYVANDFAPNNLFRNDGLGGFVDVTAETATADNGFGMGVSWGDYDNDGRQDLYVTNMYSKAGRRITAQLRGLDPRFAQSARGNSLFRNLGKRFEKTSGLKPGELHVEKAGWSWGGQFIDVNNDGYLDIHALSGFYTAPQEIARPVDL